MKNKDVHSSAEEWLRVLQAAPTARKDRALAVLLAKRLGGDRSMAILAAFQVERLTAKDIARAMGVSEDSVRWSIVRTRRFLAEVDLLPDGWQRRAPKKQPQNRAGTS